VLDGGEGLAGDAALGAGDQRVAAGATLAAASGGGRKGRVTTP